MWLSPAINACMDIKSGNRPGLKMWGWELSEPFMAHA